jgi:hypothetical protein
MLKTPVVGNTVSATVIVLESINTYFMESGSVPTLAKKLWNGVYFVIVGIVQFNCGPSVLVQYLHGKVIVASSTNLPI